VTGRDFTLNKRLNQDVVMTKNLQKRMHRRPYARARSSNQSAVRARPPCAPRTEKFRANQRFVRTPQQSGSRGIGFLRTGCQEGADAACWCAASVRRSSGSIAKVRPSLSPINLSRAAVFAEAPGAGSRRASRRAGGTVAGAGGGPVHAVGEAVSAGW